jgi:hypothetical protein
MIRFESFVLLGGGSFQVWGVFVGNGVTGFSNKCCVIDGGSLGA